MLSRLLNSTHPEDLRAANKLIKEMVQEVSACSLVSPDFFILYDEDCKMLKTIIVLLALQCQYTLMVKC